MDRVGVCCPRGCLEDEDARSMLCFLPSNVFVLGKILVPLRASQLNLSLCAADVE